MSYKNGPLVSVVTPLYNNVADLAQCIESVLAQTYQNWDYTIVNNCSTDGSGELARKYAEKDRRIRVCDNSRFLPVLANHNHALRQISPDAKYCKMVFADDWIFDRCLEEMVSVAEQHPSVGIVGAYGMQGAETAVKWQGLPYAERVVSGREICRRYLLEGVYVFGTSHSLLFRADLVRRRDPFFNEANFHADREACLALLLESDFGFAHQILTFTRERPGSLTDYGREMDTMRAFALQDFVSYGPRFLTQKEVADTRERLIREYYNFLAVSFAAGRRDHAFWDFHRRKLIDAGVGFSRARLLRALVARTSRAILHPQETMGKIRNMLNARVARALNRNSVSVEQLASRKADELHATASRCDSASKANS